MDRVSVIVPDGISPLPFLIESGLIDKIFVPRRLVAGSGTLYAEVFEGERPAPHFPEQIEGRWTDFTASLRRGRETYRAPEARG
jgi:hypothetical protein